PFADLSEDQDQQYFTDGLSEELLNVLVRIDELQVASRTSSFSFRDSSVPIPEIAKELQVAHILEGSVRRDGIRIRITAQLIETSTDRHLWSENFDREFHDIFAVQDEIATAIVKALSEELGLSSIPSVSVEAVTANLDAYQLYLEARELFVRRTRLDDSIRMFHEAIKLDPGFARAWEGLAAVEAIANDWQEAQRNMSIDHLPLAEEAANKALEIDSSLSLPHAVLGQVAARLHRDPRRALSSLAEAIERDPKNVSAWLWQGMILKYAGYLEDAIEAFRRCLDIDPARIICSDYLAETLLYDGQTELAIELHNRSIEQGFSATAPSFVSHHVRNGNRGLALMIARNKMGAGDAPVVEWIRAIETPNSDHTAGLARLNDWVREREFRMGLPPQMLFTFGAHDQMLEIGEMQRRMLFHPDAAEFRRTPQFREVVRRWGFDKLWRQRGFPPQCHPVGSDDFECD
ncbi:MAG: tetratricopeptide repeat protein, partial [Woeseiaceae bacterium]